MLRDRRNAISAMGGVSESAMVTAASNSLVVLRQYFTAYELRVVESRREGAVVIWIKAVAVLCSSM